MIDFFSIVAKRISDVDKLQIIKKNNLQCIFNISTNSKNYDNAQNKNLTGGIYLKICENDLKIEGSVHKYFHYLKYKTLENYTVFTMLDFIETIEIIFKNFSIPKLEFFVMHYEIGLNVFVEQNPIKYLNEAQSIGKLDGTQRKLYINPKYKQERFLTTQMHRDNTLVYRMYDKDFERRDRGKNTVISNCIRIETKRTRLRNTTLIEFINYSNLILIQNKFIADWNMLNFKPDILAPAGTHQSKKDLAKKIIISGSEIVLKEIENNRDKLTPKIYRTSREFIKSWESIKYGFKLKNSQTCAIWSNSYASAIQQVTNFNNKN